MDEFLKVKMDKVLRGMETLGRDIGELSSSIRDLSETGKHDMQAVTNRQGPSAPLESHTMTTSSYFDVWKNISVARMLKYERAHRNLTENCNAFEELLTDLPSLEELGRIVLLEKFRATLTTEEIGRVLHDRDDISRGFFNSTNIYDALESIRRLQDTGTEMARINGGIVEEHSEENLSQKSRCVRCKRRGHLKRECPENDQSESYETAGSFFSERESGQRPSSSRRCLEPLTTDQVSSQFEKPRGLTIVRGRIETVTALFLLRTAAPVNLIDLGFCRRHGILLRELAKSKAIAFPDGERVNARSSVSISVMFAPNIPYTANFYVVPLSRPWWNGVLGCPFFTRDVRWTPEGIFVRDTILTDIENT